MSPPLSILRRIQAAHDVQICAIEFRLKRILAVEWKVIADAKPAGSSEGKAFEMLILGKARWNAPGFSARRRTAIANCERADPHGS